MGKIINIRTSGRASFQQCRRKWDFTDDTRKNLEPKIKPAPFYLGSAFHFALEDMHGYQRYEDGAMAIRAFHIAQQAAKCPIPDDVDELVALGEGMMNHYKHFLINREGVNIYRINGVPQVEVSFKIPITQELTHLPLKKWGIDEVNYTGTFDGIAIDENGNLWIMEYKTAKAFMTQNFETDRQITAYCWAASCLFNRPVVGVIYQQHKKQVPDLPRQLSNGTYSMAETQNTTHKLYRDAMLNLYGKDSRIPPKQMTYMNNLLLKETSTSDGYVLRNKIYRNQHQLEAEGAKIITEMTDYCNPDLPLYPNPNKDCFWMCSVQNACILMDAGGDWENDIELKMTQRNEEETSWRAQLPETA